MEFYGEDILKTMSEISRLFALNTLDYRLTGIPAVNLYGYGLTTNVIDLAVSSDEAVYKAVEVLQLPEPPNNCFDPFCYYHKTSVEEERQKGFWIKIQGDIMGEPFLHPLGYKLHSKKLLLDRLDIYAVHCTRVLQCLAFIALTLDDEKTEKYKYYWNRL